MEKMRIFIEFKLPVTRASKTPRDFIVCPTRMFVFDRWHLFLMSMELYRLQAVDLVRIYIQSVPLPVYELIDYYRAEGFVEIREALHLPKMSHTPPNAIFNRNNEVGF